MLTPTTVWRISPELVAALAQRLGDPLDSYVNGTQTWLSSDGPNDIVLEWRLHPVAEFRAPDELSHYDLWEQVVAALPGPLRAGDETRPVDSLWDGLECFPAYDDDVEPAPLAHHVSTTLGIPPDASGLVDHQSIGDAWERSRGRISLVEALIDALRS